MIPAKNEEKINDSNIIRYKIKLSINDSKV